MNKEQVKGQTNETGKVKEGAGRVTADKSTECQVKVEKHGGKTDTQCGDLKDAIETKKTK